VVGSVLPDDPWLRKIAKSSAYEVLIVCLIVSNAVFLGIQVQYDSMVKDSGRDNATALGALMVIDMVYTFLFTMEWLLRVHVEKWRFLTSSDRSWNIFDTVILFMMWTEQIVTMLLDQGVSLSQMQTLRSLRVVRVFRAIRIIRIVKFLRELRVLLQSVVVALKSLLWTAIVVSMMLYMFGIAFTQGTVDYCNFSQTWADPSTDHLRKRFGSLELSVLTLYMTMTQGIAWGELIDSLVLLHTFYLALFLCFVSIALFAMLNVVTGIFVETSMHLSQLDRDQIMQDELRRKEALTRSIQLIFKEMDVDGSNTITKQELAQSLKDEHILAYFNSLELDPTDVQTLFTLLDTDDSGSINMDEFWLGVMRLKGEARSLDVAKLQYEAEWLIHSMHDMRRRMDDLKSDVTGTKPSGEDMTHSKTQRLAKTVEFDHRLLRKQWTHRSK